MGPLAIAPPHSLFPGSSMLSTTACCLTSPPRDKTKQPWTKASETLNQNKAFPSFKSICSGISKVTATKKLSFLSSVPLLMG